VDYVVATTRTRALVAFRREISLLASVLDECCDTAKYVLAQSKTCVLLNSCADLAVGVGTPDGAVA
jgi:hypothetical protein